MTIFFRFNLDAIQPLSPLIYSSIKEYLKCILCFFCQNKAVKTCVVCTNCVSRLSMHGICTTNIFPLEFSTGIRSGIY